MTLLTLADVHLAYGHRALLDGASLSLQEGERVALIGRNGEGKSSLLKILAGLEQPDDGELQLAASAGPGRAYVPQEPVFAPGQSVFEAVAEGVAEARALRERFERLSEQHAPGEELDRLQTLVEAHHGWNWEQRVQEALQRLGLEGTPADTAVATLSGGMKKRVALARALVIEPQLILYDEPTSELDPLIAITIGQEILALRERTHATSIVVTHDRDLAFGIADRIAMIADGEILEIGRPEDLRRSQHPLVRKFLTADFKPKP